MQANQDMVIAYPLQDSLYLNITNRCPNACRFCIRQSPEGVGYNLWLEHEPTLPEVIEAIGDPTQYQEVVFCGYGEPLLRPEIVIGVAVWLKERKVKVRLNTNGLADLFLSYDVLPSLKDLIDTISISLNASDAESYQLVSQSQFGEQSFEAILDFARRCKEYINEVILTVVRFPGVDLEKSAAIARDIGVGFRVREYQ